MMSMPIIFMFSGQGSQYYQMGNALFESNNTFKHWMLKADTIFHDMTGLSIIENLYHKKSDRSTSFKQTLLTHPGIFMVEHALLQVLYEKNIRPDMVLGSSVGEFSAAVAAGILSFETAMSTVIYQAQLLEAHCSEAGMLAILNDPIIYQQQPNMNQHAELAAINFPAHFIISGKNDDLKNIERDLKSHNIPSQILSISHGFHSSHIDNIEDRFKDHVKAISYHEPKIPFFSCVYGNTLTAITPNHLWDIIRCPIQFQKTIQCIENQQPVHYLDLGPSGTLATFVKYNLSTTSQSKFTAILTPYHQDAEQIENIFLKLP